METVYTKVSFPTQGQLTALFRRGDGVTVTGLSDEALCGTKLLYALGGEAETEEDYIVLVGLIGAERSEDGTVRLERRLPTLDFVCESQNRLWGCYYGLDGDKTVNEIYCSALGDFKNWRQYQGLATDSWAASVGSDGPWTGAVNYLGHPIFFKENRIHSVTVSALGAHRVDETVCRGVQKGSHRSLAVVGETLYYKSRTDVCAWQGGFPVSVSAALGEGRYEQAAAGAFGSRYYLSMRDESGAWSLFTYDIARGLWLREDELEVKYFARVDDSLWCVDGEGRLLDLRGEQGEREHAVDWAMESGIQYYEQPNRKYLSRFQIQLMMEAGASAEIYLEYDGTGVWQHQGHIALPRAGTVTVPVRPRRCTHMRMRLTGCGDVKVFSITRVLEVGSDV